METTTSGAPPEFLLFCGGLLGILALGLAALGVSKLLRASALAGALEGKIGTARPGLVRLSGRAVMPPGEPIQSPLSGATCVWYDFSVSKRQRNLSHGHTDRQTVRRGRSEAPFLIEDETGRALVDPKDAEVITGRDGFAFSGPVAANQTRVTEDLILEGNTVLVLGAIKEGGASDRVAEVLRRWKKDGAAMLARFDANGDGRIDEAEMAKVRAEAKREAQGPAEPRVVAKPASGPYLISTLSTAALGDRLRGSAWWSFASAVVFGGLATWLLRMG
ncbi:MAG TPA: hypothetical protein VGK67_32675 [Myxococcales bacterium]|jgi:hypothetical protein